MSVHTNPSDLLKYRAHIAMCPPNFFEVAYSINPFMEPCKWVADAQSYQMKSAHQWNALTDTLTKLGVNIEILQPHHGVPDLVFTANAAIVLDQKALLARFRHPERQAEEPFFKAFFDMMKTRGFVTDVVSLPACIHQEGAGDCVWDAKRQMFWAGYGPRSDMGASEYIRDFFGKPVVPLKLQTAQFYHLDVSMAPLSGGEMVYYPGAFSSASVNQILDHVEDHHDLIEATLEDASNLCVNAVNIGTDIVMAPCSDRLRGQLTERGYTLHEVPLGEFWKSGGAAFCLTLRLDRYSDGFLPGKTKTADLQVIETV